MEDTRSCAARAGKAAHRRPTLRVARAARGCGWVKPIYASTVCTQLVAGAECGAPGRRSLEVLLHWQQ